MCALRSTEMLRCQDSERAQGAGVCLCDPGNPAAAGEKRKVPAFYTGPACSSIETDRVPRGIYVCRQPNVKYYFTRTATPLFYILSYIYIYFTLYKENFRRDGGVDVVDADACGAARHARPA